MLSLSTAIFLSAVVGSALCTPVSDQITQLRLAATAVDRQTILADDKQVPWTLQLCTINFNAFGGCLQFVFDFLNPPSADTPNGVVMGVVTGAAGHTVEAFSGNFPAVIGNGVAMSLSPFLFFYPIY